MKEQTVRLLTFDSNIGICAIAFKGKLVVGLQLPHENRSETVLKLSKRFKDAHLVRNPSPWEEKIIDRLKTHLRSGDQNLESIKVNIETTPFFTRVYETVKKIPPGKSLTYGEVARLAGTPRAARAIGQAMARNPIPLIIPCHRVIGSSGKLVGFSALDGIKLKSKLLEIEQKA